MLKRHEYELWGEWDTEVRKERAFRTNPRGDLLGGLTFNTPEC